MKLLLPAFLVIILVSAGTYLLFCNTVPMITAWLKRKTSFYYKTSTFISASQIAFRLKANAKMLTLSALLCAISITMVSDAVYHQYALTANSSNIDTFYGFMFDDEMASANTTAALDRFIPARFLDGALPANMSYIGIYKANFALYGSYVFIVLFLGFLFLLSMGSVMYYKMVMEAQEESPRYAILRKVGMKKQEMRACVAKQLGIVFGTPLAVGVVHTIVALSTYNRMMDVIGQETPTFANALMVVGISLLIYGAFYLLSIGKYCGIVWKKDE